jgi:hypothetical protein
MMLLTLAERTSVPVTIAGFMFMFFIVLATWFVVDLNLARSDQKDSEELARMIRQGRKKEDCDDGKT